jgi:hypothetical protein
LFIVLAATSCLASIWGAQRAGVGELILLVQFIMPTSTVHAMMDSVRAS